MVLSYCSWLKSCKFDSTVRVLVQISEITVQLESLHPKLPQILHAGWMLLQTLTWKAAQIKTIGDIKIFFKLLSLNCLCSLQTKMLAMTPRCIVSICSWHSNHLSDMTRDLSVHALFSPQEQQRHNIAINCVLQSQGEKREIGTKKD